MTTPTSQDWWEVMPGRWSKETAALASAGAQWRRMKPRRSRRETNLRVRVLWPFNGELVRLFVKFPHAYPWTAPTVTAPDGVPGVSRHIGRDTSVCILADPDADWLPTMTLAELLAVQLPQLVAAETGAPGTEAHEPVSALHGLGSADPVGLLVDSAMVQVPDTVTSGMVVLAVGGSKVSVVCAIDVVENAAGEPVATSASRWPGLRSSLSVPFQRMDTPVTTATTADQLWQAAAPDPAKQNRPSKGVEVRLLLVRAEVQYRELGWQWVLMVRGRNSVEVAVGEPAGPSDMAARTPGHDGLHHTAVTVIGAGALGSEIARHLVRAGVGKLTIIDSDVVTAAPGCRQVPPRYTGTAKALAVGHELMNLNPHVQAYALTAKSGENVPPDMLNKYLTESTVVVDATAQEGHTRWLAMTRPNLPLIVATATWGAWGGTLTRLPAEAGGCWCCLAWHRADRTVPHPPEEPHDSNVSGGCSSPSYTGTGYDLADIAAHAARLAVATILGTGRDWDDVHVLSHRDRDGTRRAPAWVGQPLSVHPKCKRRHVVSVPVQLQLSTA
ncbi:MAG: ThiF family adenylyltransferase [Candidatus Nanopelagicales bacterium]